MENKPSGFNSKSNPNPNVPQCVEVIRPYSNPVTHFDFNLNPSSEGINLLKPNGLLPPPHKWGKSQLRYKHPLPPPERSSYNVFRGQCRQEDSQPYNILDDWTPQHGLAVAGAISTYTFDPWKECLSPPPQH